MQLTANFSKEIIEVRRKRHKNFQLLNRYSVYGKYASGMRVRYLEIKETFTTYIQ